MSGLLTAHSMRLATPSIAKRALGSHLGAFFEKYFPYWKTPKIFRNVRKDEEEVIPDKVNVSSEITGLMSYDPGKPYHFLYNWFPHFTASLLFFDVLAVCIMVCVIQRATQCC